MAEALTNATRVHRLAQLQPPTRAQTEAALDRVLLVLVTHTVIYVQFVLFEHARRSAVRPDLLIVAMPYAHRGTRAMATL